MKVMREDSKELQEWRKVKLMVRAEAERLIEFIKKRTYPIKYDTYSIEKGMTVTGIAQAIREFYEDFPPEAPINDDGSVYNAKPKFIEQIKIKDMDRQYDAGVVCERDGNYIIGYEMQGAEETFSIGQPVYDKDKNIMGWLGIGLFKNLDYSAKVRVPCEYWQICLPTKFCEVGKQVYTYWQMAESEDKE